MKYKLTDETISHKGITLHRIECVEAFGDIEIGEKGGWIEKESNLSQKGTAWIYDDAKVYGNANVFENASVFDNAEVYGCAWVCGNAKVNGKAWVRDNTEVSGNAIISSNAVICCNAKVYEDAFILGNANISDYAIVKGNANVYDNASVFGDAIVFGDVSVVGDSVICGDAKVESVNDYMVFKNNWSSGRFFTWTRSNDKWKVGCFYGTGEELIKKAYEDSQLTGDCYKVIVDSVKSISKLMNK